MPPGSLDFEGIVSKKLDAPYKSDHRRPGWKSKSESVAWLAWKAAQRAIQVGTIKGVVENQKSEGSCGNSRCW